MTIGRRPGSRKRARRQGACRPDSPSPAIPRGEGAGGPVIGAVMDGGRSANGVEFQRARRLAGVVDQCSRAGSTGSGVPGSAAIIGGLVPRTISIPYNNWLDVNGLET